MCFSVEVQKELKRIAERFNAEVLVEDEVWYEEQKKKAEDPEFIKKVLGLARKPSSNFFKEPGDDNRIYPGYFTWVMVQENGKNVLKKMRYRVRPQKAKTEIPTKFNVFNARLDSLETRQTWNPLFTRKHGLIPFTRFFEWVEHEQGKRLISFSPRNREIMWAPCLWDYWESEKKDFGFYSFALITDEPPQEVAQAGHDRCPIFLKESLIPYWLDTSGKIPSDFYNILSRKEEVYYASAWAS